MKIQSVLGLCLSGSLLLAGPIALADKDKDNDKEKSNNRSERAVQVHIDKDTGRKTAEDDSSAAASNRAAASQAASIADSQINALMPEQSEAPVVHADGTMSAKLGQENLKYVTVSIDDNGDKVFAHQSADESQKVSETTPTEKGLE